MDSFCEDLLLKTITMGQLEQMKNKLTQKLSTISKNEKEYGYCLDQHEIIDKLLNYMNKYANICSSASSSTSQLQTTHPIMKSAKEESSLKRSKELQSSDDETSLDVPRSKLTCQSDIVEYYPSTTEIEKIKKIINLKLSSTTDASEVNNEQMFIIIEELSSIKLYDNSTDLLNDRKNNESYQESITETSDRIRCYKIPKIFVTGYYTEGPSKVSIVTPRHVEQQELE